eukprot:CAMPEP_0185253580 /NCGR_PEP_ID=MMETSP1359-20130426/2270_1 /TAXON_ID=552665 /ORGANISM="Bigelowiella longifila, Strain CCMP242" /LENGTH=305 /DNA_ID=CAMNT_0027835981 /DNA_START=72 /DNA_END=989 /DNA_ORIENTATION=-
MREIAKLYGFKWKPKTEPSDHQTLGTVAKNMEDEVLPESKDFIKGTLNVTLYRGKDLYENSWLGGKKPFVTCYLSAGSSSSSSSTSKRAGSSSKSKRSPSQKSPVGEGPDPIWSTAQHFPFHIPRAGCVLNVDVNNASSARDEVIAHTEFKVDLIEHGGKNWHTLKPSMESKTKPPLKPRLELSFQFMSLEEGKALPTATNVGHDDGKANDVIEGNVMPPTTEAIVTTTDGMTATELAAAETPSAPTARSDGTGERRNEGHVREERKEADLPPAYEDESGRANDEQAGGAGGSNLDDLEARFRNL